MSGEAPHSPRVAELILVKHSLPEIVPELPRREWRLSEEGRIRSCRLAERLRNYGPRWIVSSPEPKALETAQLVATSLGTGVVETVEALHEHDDHGAPFSDEETFRAAVRQFFARPAEAIFGPETADAAHARFAAAVEAVTVGGSEPGVLVAHGRVISLFVSRAAGVDAYELWSRLGLPSFVVLDLPSYALVEVVEST